jgi:hypothetical protein
MVYREGNAKIDVNGAPRNLVFLVGCDINQLRNLYHERYIKIKSYIKIYSCYLLANFLKDEVYNI